MIVFDMLTTELSHAGPIRADCQREWLPGLICSRLGHIVSPKAEPYRYGEDNLWHEETDEEVANHGGQSEDASEICPTARRRTFESRSKKRKAEEPYIRGRIPTVHNCRDAETHACGMNDYLRERPDSTKLTPLEDPTKKANGGSANGQDCESE